MAQSGARPDPQSEELLAAERRFDAALLFADAGALDALLAEEFFLNDFLGGVTRKPQLLESLGSGELRFHGIVPHDLCVRVYREAGIVTGWTEMKAEYRGTVSEVRSRFLHVYVLAGGTWRLVSAQGTVMA